MTPTYSLCLKIRTSPTLRRITNKLYCGKWRKISKSRPDLDLGPTMPNIKLVPVIFIYYNAFKFQVPRSKTHTRKHTHTHTDAHKDSDEYSIVAFLQNATIMILY